LSGTSVLAQSTHPVWNRVQCLDVVKYITAGNPGQLSRPAVRILSWSSSRWPNDDCENAPITMCGFVCAVRRGLMKAEKMIR